MDAKNQKKVIEAGFTILRTDDHPSPRIKFKGTGTHEWKTLETDFASKAGRDRRMEQLLKSPMIIED